MRNVNGEKNNHVLEASQKLLTANSPMTEYCSAREMDVMAALTDVRSERSFNKEFFNKRINGNLLSNPYETRQDANMNKNSLFCRTIRVCYTTELIQAQLKNASVMVI